MENIFFKLISAMSNSFQINVNTNFLFVTQFSHTVRKWLLNCILYDHWRVSLAVVVYRIYGKGSEVRLLPECVFGMAWAYEVGLRSLCHMSWPAAKVTIITVASVKEPRCDGGGVCDVIK